MNAEWMPLANLAINVLVAVVAVFGSFTAWWGLRTWRKEKLWDRDHELARRTFVAMQTYAEELLRLRNPLRVATLQAHLFEQKGGDRSDETTRVQATVDAYNEMLASLTDKREGLMACLAEVDLLWGNALFEPLDRILTMDNQLQRAIDAYLFDALENAGIKLPVRGRAAEPGDSALLFGNPSEPDDFAAKVWESLSEASAILKKKMS